MEKDFDIWNTTKKQIHVQKSSRVFYFKEREIWWCSLGTNIGVEINGKNEQFERPVLILKVFNTEGFWGIPITSKDRIGTYYYQFLRAGEKNTAILSQLRFLSSRRLLRKLDYLSKEEFSQISALIKNFI